MDSIPPPTKRCTKCKQPLSLGAFAPRSGAPGKVLSRCRPCQADYLREYSKSHREAMNRSWQRYKARNPERVREQNARYREAHRDQMLVASKKCGEAKPDLYREYGSDYSRAHPEVSRSSTAAHKMRHPERVKEQRRRYEETHHAQIAEKARPVSSRRRAQKRGNGGSFTVEDWEAVKARYNWTCLACGKREPDIKLHADHVVPLFLGGWNIISNTQPLCRHCNASKGTQFIEYRPDFLTM